MIELLDLPDELILYIFNKVKPHVLLFGSIIGIGNNRLEQLVLDKCHSIDLSFDYYRSPYEPYTKRFYSHVMPHIYKNIQSLTFNLQHLSNFVTFAEKICDGTLPNLKHLKIMIGKKCSITGTIFTLGNNFIDCSTRQQPLVSTLPELFVYDDTNIGRQISNLRCSRFVRSIISFEVDNDCILPKLGNNNDLFFPQSHNLTHIRVTLSSFDGCIHLLRQLGSQLQSLTVSLTVVFFHENSTISQMRWICCPNLKQLTIICYRNISEYEQCIVSLLQRLLNVEYLTLLLAIGYGKSGPNRFIDGFCLQRDIISFMPHLRQFNFHIRSIVPNAPHTDIDTIRQTFGNQPQSVDCVIDYFNNNYGQCQVFSLPFIGTRLDFISNRFPLCNVNNIFSSVTTLLLFDDVKPFENTFFGLVAQALPHLKSLEIINQLEQKDKTKSTVNFVEFTRLITLILYNIHVDYTEQMFIRSHLPCLVELFIHYNSLAVIIAQNQQKARENCSKIELIRVADSADRPMPGLLEFFPNLHCKLDKKRKLEWE